MDKDNPVTFFEEMYEKNFSPKIRAKQDLKTWVVTDNNYQNYKKFNDIFSNYDEKHKDYGNGYLYYKRDMQYPIDIDPLLDYQKFLKSCISDSDLPIKVKEFRKAWGVHYGPGAYSGLHSHTPGTQLTAVMFLTHADQNESYPLAGNLLTLQPMDHEINYIQHPTKPGDVVIMDGKVFHGTYPTLNDRKVFVCDFDYELV